MLQKICRIQAANLNIARNSYAIQPKFIKSSSVHQFDVLEIEFDYQLSCHRRTAFSEGGVGRARCSAAWRLKAAAI